jgi:ribosomal-protein-alanine N-acetyltransferase
LNRGPIAFPDEGLSDGRIRLRLFGPDDLDDIREAADEPEVARYTTVPSPYTATDARAWLVNTTAGLRAGTDLHPIIVDADTGELLGACGVAQRPGDPGNWGIGYWIAKAHRGRGVAAAGVRLLAPYAFEHLGVERLELQAEESNPGSVRTAEACGFKREGTLRSFLVIAGERRDMVSFSLLRGEAIT